MSNYPAGVTGREYEIAGPDSEWYETKEVSCENDECADFEKEIEVEVDLQSYRSEWWGEWTCPTCKSNHEIKGEMSDYEPDEDYYRDR